MPRDKTERIKKREKSPARERKSRNGTINESLRVLKVL